MSVPGVRETVLNKVLLHDRSKSVSHIHLRFFGRHPANVGEFICVSHVGVSGDLLASDVSHAPTGVLVNSFAMGCSRGHV
jgi:hypothetical protein